MTRAKAEFSNSQNANIQKWSAYIKGDPNRQGFLERALDWVSKGEIGGYMSAHRYDNNINELKTYFNSVIDWVSAVFIDVKKEMQGLEWGEFYEKYHTQSYNPKKVSAEVARLYGDPYIEKRRGIFEYILGGEKDSKLLEVRVFDDATKHSVYEKQTSTAKAKNKSNCPLCAMGHDANKSRIYKPTRWTQTTLKHGVRVAIVRPRTAKCCALPTIGPKVSIKSRDPGPPVRLTR